MSWYGFWKSGERYCDRLYTTGTTMMVLKVGGYVEISWLAIWLLLLIAFVGDVTFGFFAVLADGGLTDEDLAQ